MADRTPDDVLNEIRTARGVLEQGSSKLYESELAAERAEDAAQLAFDRELLTADGSVPEKQAQARLASAAERDQAFIARAELNRVKSKIRALEQTMMSLQSELRWMRDEGA